MAPKHPLGLIRIAVFEVDCRAGELRKHGRKIRLQDLPFLFLTALLERTGERVTRDELAWRPWPIHALIDIDNGLNTAARKLRIALGDDADTPRFVETLPRRGYRFIGIVQSVVQTMPSVDALPVHDPQAADTAAAVAAPETTDAVSAPLAAELPRRRSSRRWAVARCDRARFVGVPASVAVSLLPACCGWSSLRIPDASNRPR